MPVTELFGFAPHMPRHNATVAAKLRHRQNTMVGLRRAQLLKIHMPALEIPATLVKPTGCVVNQTRGVQFPRQFGDAQGFKLPPTLIERHPHSNTGYIVKRLNHRAVLNFKLFAVFRILPAKALKTMLVIAVNARGEAKNHHHVLGRASAVDHILPHNHSQAVTCRVPAHRLHLDMFANHIAAYFFGVFDIEKHRFFAGWRVKPIGKVTLVEQTIHEDKLVVQRHAPVSVFVLCTAKLAHGEIAVHAIHHIIIF